MVATATACLGAGHANAWAPFTYETPAEFSSAGDFNGDGRADLAVLDRASGGVSFLLQLADGGFDPSPAVFTGLDAPDSLAAGRVKAGVAPQSLLVASSADNRVLAIDPLAATATAANLNGLLFPSSLAVVATPAAPTAPPGVVLLSSEQNDAPTPRRLTQGGPSGPGVSFSTTGLSPEAPLRRGNPVALPGSATAAGFVSLDARGPGFRLLTDAGNLAAPAATTAGLPANPLWTYGTYAPAREMPAFLFYARQATFFTTRQAGGALAQPVLIDAGSHDLGKPIHLLLTIDYAEKAWLLALFDDGRTATLFEFDGISAPVARQSWTAPAGENFTQAAALGEGGFLLLSGPGGRSMNWHRYDYDGSRHHETKSGAMAAAGELQRKVTLFVFDEEPFVNDDARVFQLRQEGDWTTVNEDLSGTLAGPWRITKLSDRGSAPGLGDPTDVQLTFGAGLIPIINQYLRPQPEVSPISISTFSNRRGDLAPRVVFDPAPGNYPQPRAAVTPNGGTDPRVAFPATFPVTLASSAGAAAPIWYRFSPGEAWKPYTGQPLQLTAITTIFAYTVGSYPAANTRSPVAAATWTFDPPVRPTEPMTLPPGTDENGNGLPDAWERAFNQSDPAADTDGDGLTAAQEYAAGSDPLDPSDSPSPRSVAAGLALAFEMTTAGDGRPVMQLRWSPDLGSAELQYSSDLKSWAPVTSGIERRSDGFIHQVPLDGAAAAGFFRLFQP